MVMEGPIEFTGLGDEDSRSITGVGRIRMVREAVGADSRAPTDLRAVGAGDGPYVGKGNGASDGAGVGAIVGITVGSGVACQDGAAVGTAAGWTRVGEHPGRYRLAPPLAHGSLPRA